MLLLPPFIATLTNAALFPQLNSVFTKLYFTVYRARTA